MEFFTTIFKNQFKPWWDTLDSGSKLIYVAVSIASVVAIVISAVFLLRPSYETLYVSLDTDEAGQVVEKLKEYKVSYRLVNGGATVEVPRKDIYDVRLRLASEGLPRSGSLGYEILDKSNLGMTDFLQKINYRRALEGEIAKSIRGIRGVESARVHIVIPEPRLFKEDKKEATASVVLNLGGAGGISSRQVEGIIYLVSSSVEGLSPDNITVIDSRGRLLSSKKQGSELGALSSSQLGLQEHVETYLEDKALSMLRPVVGPGNAVVRVSAKMNFERVEQTIENYDPDNLSIRSEERISDQSSEENTDAEGRGKIVSNSTENVVTNYEVNRTVQHIVSQIGNIERLWISVVVDGIYKELEGKSGVVEEYVPRSQEELDRIAGIVKGAIGYDPDRNDVLEIANVPFQRQEEYDYSESFFNTERIEQWIPIGIKFILGIIGFMIFMKVRKKFHELMEIKKIDAKRRAAQRETERKREELLPKIKSEPQLIDHMRDIAKDNPAEIARVVKTMMSEEK